MNNLKTIGVKDLKNNLSAYLREVKRGITIFVTDRNIVVAELREPLSPPIVYASQNDTLADWIDNKIVTLPKNKRKEISKSPLKLKNGVALRLLDEDRSE